MTDELSFVTDRAERFLVFVHAVTCPPETYEDIARRFAHISGLSSADVEAAITECLAKGLVGDA